MGSGHDVRRSKSKRVYRGQCNGVHEGKRNTLITHKRRAGSLHLDVESGRESMRTKRLGR